MSADVNTISRHQAYCLECGWFSEELESQDAADRDADEHDEEFHP